VVNANGSLASGHRDGFEVGCSHSWTSRVVRDPRTGHYVMVCATDNACRIARPNPYRTVAPGACDGTLFGGDLVLAKTKGYWTAWSQGGKVRLEHFTTGRSDTTVRTSASSSHPHTINVRDHNYHAFKAYADGSVANPAAGGSNTSIRIARVMPLSSAPR
jgi:hypothetical protein